MPRVTTTLTAYVRAPVQTVFSFITAYDVLPKILLGYGPIPGVASADGNTERWHTPGSFRTVYLKNGSSAREEVTDHQPPTYFAYRTSAFTSVLRYLVSEGRGQWRFAAQEQATQVTWTYTFTARTWFTKPALKVFVWLWWRGYMGGALRELKAQTEAPAPASG